MNIFIRTNFNNLVGLGHIKRSTRLATELKNRGHDCFFYLDNFNSNIKINFKSYFIYSNKKKYFDEIEDAKSFLSITKKNQPGIVIVDDYRIGIKWEKYVSKYHKKIVVFDDLETKKHYADFIVNYNPRNYPIIKYDFKKNKKKKMYFFN